MSEYTGLYEVVETVTEPGYYVQEEDGTLVLVKRATAPREPGQIIDLGEAAIFEGEQGSDEG